MECGVITVDQAIVKDNQQNCKQLYCLCQRNMFDGISDEDEVTYKAPVLCHVTSSAAPAQTQKPGHC